MRATFALLADPAIANQVRRLAWQLHLAYQTGTIGSRLPPHVSLKQPFKISDPEAVGAYMAGLARSIRPFELELTEFQLIPFSSQTMETAILWIEVKESPKLRALHDRLNRELESLFGHTQADHDGPAYHFHLTVAMGVQPAGVYQRLFRSLPEIRVDRRFEVRELAMFVYDEPLGPQAEWMVYKILPLG